MWQLFALASVLASSTASVIDKEVMVADRKVDLVVASFWRMALVAMVIAGIGAFGWFGSAHLIPSLPILLVAAMGIGNSLCYSYLLRRVEITVIGAFTYAAPFLFFLIDTQALHISFSPSEVSGILLLVLGGFAFAIDGKTHHLKKEFSPIVWLMFLYGMLYVGIQAYIFKFVHATAHVSSIEFCFSYAFLMALGLLVIVLVTGRSALIWNKPSRYYATRESVAKLFDGTSSVLWMQALTGAAVSQVTAMGSLEPLMIFIVTVIAQLFLKFKMDERLGGANLRWKATAVSCLVLGGFLIT